MLDPQRLDALVAAALAEDVGDGDATTAATVPRDHVTRARIVAREDGVVAGGAVLERVFLQLDPACEIRGFDDGSRVEAGAVVWSLSGQARALLTGERVALNFVQRLSGIATLTARFVRVVGASGVAISDTRKTTPSLRWLEKHAVRCGGGVNHRSSLDSMLLVKENHIAIAGSLRAAVRAALDAAAGREVEVEVRNVEELRAALELDVARVLLDHWSPRAVAQAVRLRGPGPKPALEVSGNITLANVRDYAIPGVQFVSVGALTHSAPAFDFSMLVEGAR